MESRKITVTDLAINGGDKTRVKPWPGRGLFGQEEKAAVDALFDKSIASGDVFSYDGPAERAYCDEFAAFMGGGYADAVNGGTNAVYVALKALNIEPFTEVVVSPITDPGGMMPIALLNCIPVVADAVPGSFNVGAEQIEACITPLTSAIVVAHIMGEPADMMGIMAIAHKYGIPVVEDCAQSHYAKLNGRLLGTFGDIGAFSTMSGKHHATGAQGGIVFTKSEDLYHKIRRASDRGKPFFLPPGSSNPVASLNFNLGDLGATIGSVQLKKLPSIVERRQALVKDILAGIVEVPAITVPKQVVGASPSYWWLRLEVNTDAITCSKKEFVAALAAEGIRLNGEYTAFPSKQAWFVEHSVFGTSGLPWSSPQYKGDLNREYPIPNAMASVAKQFLLAVWESWGQEEVDDIVTAIKKVAQAFSKEPCTESVA